MRGELVLMGGEERRSSKHRDVHRAEVVAEAGQGDLAGLDRAAGLAACSTTATDQPRLKEMDRGGEAVVSSADDDGVECVHPALSSPN